MELEAEPTELERPSGVSEDILNPANPNHEDIAGSMSKEASSSSSRKQAKSFCKLQQTI